MRKTISPIAVASLALGLLLCGCGKSGGTDTRTTEKTAAPKEYPMRGEIMSLDPGQHVASIKHEKIEGFMAAMTMGYPIKDPAEFAKLKVGDTIKATVYVSADDMWVGDIQKVPRDDAHPAN